MKRCFSIMLSVALALSAVNTGFAQDDKKVYTLTFASSFMETHPIVTRVFKPWIEELRQKSNGRLDIVYYNPNTICSESEIFDAIMEGRVSMGTQNAGRNPGRLAMTTTYAKASMGCTRGYAATMGYYAMLENHPEFMDEFKGMKVLWLQNSAIPNVVTVKKPVKTLEEMQGLRIMTPGGDGVHMVKAIGGRGIQMPSTDFYLSLQRSMAEGVIASVNVLSSFKLQEVAKYSTICGFPSSVEFAGMNMDVWNELPADLQKLIEEHSGKAMALRLAEGFDIETDLEMKRLEEAGHQFYLLPEAERARWTEELLKVGAQHSEASLKPRGIDGRKYFGLAHGYASEAEKKYGREAQAKAQ